MNISVIIPTFNREKLVIKAIESVLNQKHSYGKIEIIVVDDGSIDNTKQSLSEYNIKYIYQSNNGVSSTRNIGIKSAKYDWIMFLDSDDIFEDTKIAKQVKYHTQHPNIMFSHTSQKWIRNDKVIKKSKGFFYPQGQCFVDNLKQCFISVSSVMIHKSIFEDIGYFDESLLVCEDYDMWLKISEKYEMGYISEELIIKYAGHTQLSSQIKYIDTIHIDILKQFLNSKYKTEVLRQIIRKCRIILQGAKKFNNNKYLVQYSQEQENAQKLLDL